MDRFLTRPSPDIAAQRGGGAPIAPVLALASRSAVVEDVALVLDALDPVDREHAVTSALSDLANFLATLGDDSEEEGSLDGEEDVDAAGDTNMMEVEFRFLQLPPCYILIFSYLNLGGSFISCTPRQSSAA